MKIADQKVVGIHYTLTDKEGKQLDSSEGGEPLMYLHGAGNIVEGLESALTDKEQGDQLNVVVEPAQGYGDYNEGLKQEVPKSAFQGVDRIEVGAQFQAQSDQGAVSVTVVEVSDDSVVVDGNHPLAGQALHFDVTVTEVRDASDEEIAHGHVH